MKVRKKLRWASRPFVVLNRWVLWVQQGRPTDGPVVLAVGDLQQCPSCGYRWIEHWWWYGKYMKTPINASSMWDFLAARYEIESRYCGPKCVP